MAGTGQDAQSRPLRVLLFSTLYPSAARPGHGLFVHTRLAHLMGTGQVQARVVAPVPWFPSTHPRFGDWARMAATPRREQWAGVDVLHPRYALPPKVGQTVAPFMLAAGALRALRGLRSEGFDFDLIDAHYFYPDGVAAALLGRWLDRPVVITARGSDLNVLGHHPVARGLMRRAAQSAAASVGVCQALADILMGWGVASDKVHVVRNGVDLERFRPLPPAASRARLGLEGGPLVLSVGNLVPVKGHELAIDAVAALAPRLPGIRLLVVGRGPRREALEAHCRSRGVHDRVRFVGPVPNEELLLWYSAADLLVLASHSEGWANVLLESMACGTPVVATDAGGSAEVLGDGPAGVLVRSRSVAEMAAAIERTWHERPDRAAVRRYAEAFSWDATSAAQLEIFRRATAAAGAGTDATRLPAGAT